AYGGRVSGDEAGGCLSRSGGRDRWHPRADGARFRDRAERRVHARAAQSGQHVAPGRQSDVREERGCLPRAHRAGRQAPPRFRRPNHPRHVRDVRRRGAQIMSDFGSMVFVFVLATFIGLGVIRRVSRLLYTPLMSLTNAISAIAVVGSIVVTGGDHPLTIRILGAVASFASMTNIVSGFMITDRMLKMFKKQ